MIRCNMEKINTSEQGSLTTKVFKILEKAILKGEFLPGEALTEQSLSNQLGVSRTPVREALRQLELAGLVKTVPNKGAEVVGISEKDVDDIYTIRVHIEGLAARWAAEHISEEDIKKLRDTLELQEFYASKGDTDRVKSLDSSFHEAVYKASESNPLRQILSQLHNYIQSSRGLSIDSEGRAVAAVAEHRKIFEAIESGNGDLAEIEAQTHIINAKQSLLRVKNNK